MADQQEVVERRGREGGRWINERPSSEDFAEWFRGAMKIDEALSMEDYVGGVVLIPAVDTKSRYVKGFQNGKPIIEHREELSFIPYAKVETRIAYFWDLLAAHREDWVGTVERITSPRPPLDPMISAVEAIATAEGATPELAEKVAQVLVGRDPKPGGLTTLAYQLPPGFSLATVPVGDTFSAFLCCTIRVSIYDKTQYEEKGADAVPLRVGQGTKQVPLAKSYDRRSWADDSSLMKAETGALGRALGFAGIFVIPGSGVATAEDMADESAVGDAATSQQPDANQGPAAPEAPVRAGAERAEDEEAELKQRATALWQELREDFPGIVESEFKPWAAQRKLTNVAEAKGAMLRGLVRTLERLLDQGKQGQPEREEGADVPGETGDESNAKGGAADGESD